MFERRFLPGLQKKLICQSCNGTELAYSLGLSPIVQIMPNRFNCLIIPLSLSVAPKMAKSCHSAADNEFSVRDGRLTPNLSVWIERRHQLSSLPSA